jgi:uncharacterized membrane protein
MGFKAVMGFLKISMIMMMMPMMMIIIIIIIIIIIGRLEQFQSHSDNT